MWQQPFALRHFNPVYVGLGVRLGHSAVSVQCPVCPKADTAERRAAPHPVRHTHDRAMHAPMHPASNSGSETVMTEEIGT